MGLISPGDCDLLLDFVRELHEFRDVSVLLTWLLDSALPRLVPSDWISYNEVDIAHLEKTVAIQKPEFDASTQRLFPRFQELAHQHPLIIRQMQAESFPVHKISDFLTQDTFHQLALYQEVYRPLGVEYQMAMTIKLEPGRVTAFALSRREWDYSERDRAILERLRPHLVVAFNNLALARQNQTVLADHFLALSRLSSATIIVNAQGRILYHTGHALRWIVATSLGMLPGAVFDWLTAPATDADREPLRLPSVAGEILIDAVPTTSPERMLLVLTLNEGPATKPSANDFGLTQREGEVARWICEGKSNKEIAAILGVSLRTVHKHIEHIYEKTGVHSRMVLNVSLNGKASLIPEHRNTPPAHGKM